MSTATLCARCGKEATIASPSGRSAYCEVHAKCDCGIHTAADLIEDKERGIYRDPCIANATQIVAEQEELWKAS